jgi:hypothetical protein
MDAPDIFDNIDPGRISRSKAEETLLYVRYLLKREQDTARIRIYENLKVILEARLEDLTEREVLPPLDLPTRSGIGEKGISQDHTDQG